jgi:hypothetical protein
MSIANDVTGGGVPPNASARLVNSSCSRTSNESRGERSSVQLGGN